MRDVQAYSQGSVIGLLLYLICINLMNKAVHNSIIHYFADYTILLSSHKNLKSSRKSMKQDLSALHE